MTVTPPLAYCAHGYAETEHCRTCEIMDVCKRCESEGGMRTVECVCPNPSACAAAKVCVSGPHKPYGGTSTSLPTLRQVRAERAANSLLASRRVATRPSRAQVVWWRGRWA